MLEDCTMDKKSAGRAAQAPGKGSGTDCKKSQDASSTSKSFPRGPRKRETTGPSIPKYDQNRKSQPQKSKAFDKRPRPRGQYLASGKEDPKVGEEGSEYGSVLAHGSKKVNLNHLLNFHYSPKDAGSYTHGRPGSGSNRWLYNTQRHKYNKEQFLQANCQFVVKANGDYSRYLHDPDMLVEWALIEQIRVQSSELLSCPICLSPPTAAKMTRCGHVFCWPCMLHYLALADKSWRKCPICYESVHQDDLKSVIALCHVELSVGEVVSMQLMRRERGTLVAVPVERGSHGSSSTPTGPVSVAENTSNTLYCKLLIATPSQVLNILQQEGAELKQRLEEEEGTPEICFTEQALELLSKRQVPLYSAANTETIEMLPEAACQVMTHVQSQPSIIYASAFDNEVQEVITKETVKSIPAEERRRYESISSEGQESVDSHVMAGQQQEDTDVITVEDLETPAMLQQTTSEASSSKYFYFYQAADGQHMYLHSLNARMLEAMYGSLEASPRLLQGRIVEKEVGSMTTELRQRLRYLQHLPVTCQFEVAELELRPPTVSRDTLHRFQDQLEQRRKKRQRRARDERRREKRITEEENKRWGRYPTPQIKIESHLQFPECGMDNSPPMSSHQYPDMPSQSPPTEVLADLHLDSASGPSFAQMLRTGQGHSEKQPSLRRQPAPQAPTSHSDGEPDPEGYVPAPSFSKSFGDAFAQALEQATASSTPKEGDQTTQETTAATGRKKKKPKQKVLFSTGMACNSK